MFHFNFGKKKPSIYKYAVVGVVLSGLVATLSQCTGVSSDGIWDLVDEVQRKYFPNGILNEFVLTDKEKLNRRIQRDVDKAIAEYGALTGDDGIVRIPPPKYIENSINTSLCYTPDCQSLGGETRLCSPWMPDCPRGLPEGAR